MNKQLIPSCPASVMRERMHLYQEIRQFFNELQVNEVETPILSPYATTDVHIDSFVTDWSSESLYLQTSPEFFMKRMLASGFGDCFQMAKVFRHEAKSRRHVPEFTMLEWYRVGFSMHELMDEMVDLVKTICPEWRYLPIEMLTYQDVFARLGVDPHQDSLETLKQKITALSDYTPQLADERDEWLDFLLVTQIEHTLGQNQLTFLTHYPASMAALAKKTTDDSGNIVAARFELYYQGIELANGFHELTDADEQEARFIADNDTRQGKGKPVLPYDTQLIGALRCGLPDCSGVAMGLDRLLMLKLGLNTIAEVLFFD